MASRAGIALGSNLGNRLSNLREARDLLLGLMPKGTAFLQAPIYQSEPVNCPDDSPDFFNTVVEIDYTKRPYDLLRDTQGIEYHLGRVAVSEPNAPRIIDLDILYFGEEKIEDGVLTLPHPGMTHRRFVLRPLADIRPELVLPGDETTIGQHLRKLDSAEPELTLVRTVW